MKSLTSFAAAVLSVALMACNAPQTAGTAVPTATGTGFALPATCSYVGSPSVTTPGPVTTWEFTCGSSPDRDAVERLTPVFAQQGWTLCKRAQGRGFWSKGTSQIVISQSAVGNPLLSQSARVKDDCP